jgi:flagellar basal-body rod protein FlgB
MGSSIDGYLGVHAQALSLESRRTELLAANIANADTPNYKARDLDFKASLASAAGSGGIAGAAPLQLRTPHSSVTAANIPITPVAGNAAGAEPAVLYRVPTAPALDGNTVDEQLEQGAFAENSVRYQATLTLLSGKLRALMTAITGQ